MSHTLRPSLAFSHPNTYVGYVLLRSNMTASPGGIVHGNNQQRHENRCTAISSYSAIEKQLTQTSGRYVASKAMLWASR